MSKHKSEISNRKSMMSEAELSQIEQAAAEYDWETVRDLTAEALIAPDLTPDKEFDLRRLRVEANEFLGEWEAMRDDLEKMIALSASSAAIERRIKAMSKLSIVLTALNREAEAREFGEQALALARQGQDKGLEAEGLNALGKLAAVIWDIQSATDFFDQALAAARAGVNLAAESYALSHRGWLYLRTDELEKGREMAATALVIAEEIGDHLLESEALYVLGVYHVDAAKGYVQLRRQYEFAKKTNYVRMLRDLQNNMAMAYRIFGLYGLAVTYARSAVQEAEKRDEIGLVYFLETLSQVGLGSGDLKMAIDAANRVLDIALAMDNETFASWGHLDLGIALVTGNDVANAQTHLEKANALLDARNDPIDKATALAWLAAAHLAQNARAAALARSAEAIALIQDLSPVLSSFPLQDIWYWRYRSLSSADNEPVAEETWHALDQARQIMLGSVANISDEGLRRNYLNKKELNRLISRDWVKEATKRGLSLAPFSKRDATPAAVAEQLHRIVESGARLSAERNTDTLAEFILQEFVELSGVERAAVALSHAEPAGADEDNHSEFQNPKSEIRWASIDGVDENERKQFEEFVTPFIEQAAATRTPRLVDTAGNVPEGGIPELHLRSVLALPLISQDRLWGVLYGDMGHLFGRLNENDRDVLSLLANQAGAALENADWVETLEQQVADRTAEAESARKEAERANEAKSAFMSNMSHELRTPLNAIIGFTRIVKRKTQDQIPQKQSDNLDKVLSSGEHLLGLINTVLDIAKIEAGRMDVINRRLHIGPLIKATTNVAQPLLKPGVALHLDIADGLPELVSDQDKIKQILLNLLSNAAKFTHEGSITVSARQEGDTLIIDVTDTGIGMNEEALGRVFEEFQQADNTTRKEYGGTGLGLPISKHLAQLLGGDLTVTSIEGEGSTFTLTLPIEAINS